jgi:hypothetical protein
MRSLRSISMMRDSSVRPNLRNSAAGFLRLMLAHGLFMSSGPWPLRPDGDRVGFGFTNLHQLPRPSPALRTQDQLGPARHAHTPLRSEAPDNASTSGGCRSRQWRGVIAASHTRVHGGVERFGKHTGHRRRRVHPVIKRGCPLPKGYGSTWFAKSPDTTSECCPPRALLRPAWPRQFNRKRVEHRPIRQAPHVLGNQVDHVW